MSYYTNFINLCNDRKISPYKVCKQLGLCNSAVDKWRKGQTPNVYTLYNMAIYFHCRIEDLLEIERLP